ncbi:MAG: hypothetical protein Phog2KO_03340 [Phototrophicaceae bacterium]
MNTDTLSYPEKTTQEKTKRKRPDKFVIKQQTDGLEIHYPWLGKQHKGLLFFAVIWNVFIGFFTFMMLFGMASDSSFEPIILCFLTPFYAVGIGMGYYVLTGFLNRTTITIRQNGVESVHSPLPALGTSNKQADRHTIEQIYCRRRTAYESNDVPVYVFDIHYVQKGGEDTCLIKGLDSISKAVFIEQQIERLYHIDDVMVDGEYRSQF